MPQRLLPLVTGEYYHVFNRSIHKEPIFKTISDCKRALLTLDYYNVPHPPIRLAYFLALGVERRLEILHGMKQKGSKLVEIVTYCLMPNHYHLLIKQQVDNGISTFLALVQNSYTRFFNTKHNRQGHVFQGQFKAVRIEDDEQLLHTHRYIHLNPYSSFVVKKLIDLESFPFSSLQEYLNPEIESICEKEFILQQFKERTKYKQFIFDQADYQRSLETIKHLLLE